MGELYNAGADADYLPGSPYSVPGENTVPTFDSRRFVPNPSPETQEFWDGTKAGELRLQRCEACDHAYFPPRPFCPRCAGRKVRWFTASGRGQLYSYVIHHRPVPGFVPPYSIAVVELDEGPRMMTNIVHCPQTPEALQLDMPVEVTFTQISDAIWLPQFQPAAVAS
jgi:uncharacterized OB-fold protein